MWQQQPRELERATNSPRFQQTVSFVGWGKIRGQYYKIYPISPGTVLSIYPLLPCLGWCPTLNGYILLFEFDSCGLRLHLQIP